MGSQQMPYTRSSPGVLLHHYQHLLLLQPASAPTMSAAARAVCRGVAHLPPLGPPWPTAKERDLVLHNKADTMAQHGIIMHNNDKI